MDNLLWLLATPRTALKRLLVTQPIGLGLFVLVVAQLSTSFAKFLATTGTGAVWAVMDAMFAGTLALVCVFIGTAFFHLFATMLGGRGNPGQLFWGLMVSGAPWVLATPLVIVAVAASAPAARALAPGANTAGVFNLMLFVGTLALAVWSVGLKAYVISSLYNLSGSGGLFVFFVGFGTALVLASTAAFCFGMSGIVWMVALAGN